MKIIEKKLYLTLQECVDSGLREQTIISAKKDGVKCWVIINDPDDNRKLLVSYEDLKECYRKQVDERFVNVYDQVARLPILDMVLNDYKAVEWYKGYRYDNGTKYLPIGNTDKHTGGTVNKYVRAASWLNMLRDLDKQVVKKVLKLSVAEFYLHVGELISQERERGKKEGYEGPDVLPGDFPGTYQRLMARVASFAEAMAKGPDAAYGSLLDARMENKSAAKLGKVNMDWAEQAAETPGLITSPVNIEAGILPVLVGDVVPNSGNKTGGFDPQLLEKQMALIRHCAALGNNLNAGQVKKIADVFFVKNGWECVSIRRISQIMKENEDVLMPGRRGKREWSSKKAMQNKRKTAPYPMVFCTLDGWTVELGYNAIGPKGIEYAKRLVVVVVLDVFNKYPLGYAIGERETADLIKQACRNAVIHTQELFGKPYQPIQLQSDNYQIKHLTPFYQAMTGKYFTPAAVGNSKAKVIEPYFDYLNNICQSRYKNWTGHNVDAAKKNQPNNELLDLIKDQFPDKKGVIKQIEDVISSERRNKVEAYIAKWAELPEDDKFVVGPEDYLMMFGEELNGRTNKITGQGIIKQIDGQSFTFDSFDAVFRNNQHLDWMLMGDKDNLSVVLALSPDKKMRCLLHQKRELPMDIYSTTQADVDYRMRVQNFNQNKMDYITELYGKDADMVHEVVRNTPGMLTAQEETDLKLMLTVKGQQKDRLSDAKRLLKEQRQQERSQRINADDWEKKQQEYIEKGRDFSQYK